MDTPPETGTIARMTPQELLEHSDNGHLWPADHAARLPADVPAAYQRALEVRALRAHRGELPCGYKVGFTNRTIWPIYQVFAPIWGTVYSSTLTYCEGEGVLDLTACSQPRLEPEVSFGMRATPPADASLEQLFDAIDWIAPSFEVVQSHQADWKFNAVGTITDGALHARLLVGAQLPVRDLAASALELDALLAGTSVALLKNDEPVAHGHGSHVLDSPLRALHHFLAELRSCAGATDLQAGDVITTGTWTDAFPIAPGEIWQSQFSDALAPLTVRFK